jgi:serine/threonine protein kinase
MSKHDPYINKLIFGKYLIRKKIGKGSFGTVYQGVNTENNGKIAVKIEKREKNDQGTLESEAKRLIYLQGEGIPKVYCYGNNLLHNLLVEELLGKSLEDIFNAYGKPFSLKTVCVIGIEMIKRIRYIHSKYYIHRDIKPDNFMVGRGENEKKLYIIDFGLAKKYYSVSKAQHIKFVTGKHLTGTARYCGRNAHRGYEQGRRDDIESIGYVLMYFLLGVLPWQGLRVKKNEDQFEKIAQKKYSTTFEELTEGQPEEFLLYFKHCDNLHFETKPNYVYLIELFQTMIDKYCNECFYDFDWNKDLYSYYSRETTQHRKSIDISLIVNKNNDASAVDISIEANENEEENGENKKIKKKEVFMGEDNTPINNEDMDNDILYNNNKGKVHRSRSMVNIKKNINVNYLKGHQSPKKKSTRVSQVYDNNNGFGNNTDRQEIKNENSINDSKDNNENENDNKINENNDEYDNQKSIHNSKRNNDINCNSYNKEEGYINQDNDYPPYFGADPQYLRNNSNRNNDYYNDDIGQNSNNVQNYDKDENYNGEIKNEDEENETKNQNDDDNNLNYSKDIHDLSFEPEERSKKKRRNRSGSVDDRKYKDNNVVCKCNIF